VFAQKRIVSSFLFSFPEEAVQSRSWFLGVRIETQTLKPEH
jgi:hypothetical protein